MQKAERIAKCIIIIFAVYTIVESLNMGLGSAGATGSGFVSFGVGSLLFLITVFDLLKSFRIKEKDEESHTIGKTFFNVIIFISCGIFVILATPYLGIIIPIFIIVTILAKLTGISSWKEVIILGIGSAAVIFVIFNVLLKINLPKGFLGI